MATPGTHGASADPRARTNCATSSGSDGVTKMRGITLSGIRLSVLGLACWIAATEGGQASAGDTRPFPFQALDVEGVLEGTHFEPDQGALRTLSGLDDLRMTDVPFVDGTMISLDLERLHLERFDLGVHVDGEPDSSRVSRLDLSLWRGTVAGENDSEVYLGFSVLGSRGWIRRGNAVAHLLAIPRGDRWEDSIVRIAAAPEIPPRDISTETFCSDLPELRIGAPIDTKSAPAASAGVLECRIAVDCDYQLYQKFSNVAAELTYVLTLLGSVSSRYEEQIDVVLTFPYLNVWSTPADPWTTQDLGGGSLAALYEFRDKWANKVPGGAHLGHLLSGANLGGGVAYLDVLCNPMFGFGVSGNLHGSTEFPVVPHPMSWDFNVVAHEIGHNFSAGHTHTECPPLDQCAPHEYFGSCQQQQVCSSQGTIMSYCHFCPGGDSNITTYFHSKHVTDMRTSAEASCMKQACAHYSIDYANGAANTASLTVTGDPIPGYSISYALAGMPSSASGALFLYSSGFNEFKALGGTLYPALVGAQHQIEFVPLSSGSGTKTLPIPPIAGMTVYAQALAPAGGPFGWTFTNGLATSVCPCVVPPAPGYLTAAAIGAESATIVWTDHAKNEVAFRVAKLDPGEDPNDFGQWDNVGGDLPINTTSFSIGGLVLDGAYQFRVRAKNACGEFSAYSNILMLTPACAKPATPTNLAVAGVGTDWVTLKWQDNAVNEIAYRVSLLDPGEDPNNFDHWDNVGGDLPAGTTSFSIGGLTKDGTYAFRVRAKNVCGEYSEFSNIVGTATTCTLPATPSGLVVLGIGENHITVAWVDNAWNETAYRVSKLDPGEDPNNFAHWDNVGGNLPANTTSYTIGGLTCGSTYQIRVRCENACGEFSPFSNIVVATTSEPAPPPAPYNCVAVGVGNTPQPDPVKITWNYSGPPVAGFRVARLDPDENPDNFAHWDNVGGDLPPTASSYTDTKNLQNGKLYYYKVRCFFLTPCGKVYSDYSNMNGAKP